MAKDVTVAFSDKERALIERVAAERGTTFEETANDLAHEALARKVKRKTGRTPAGNVKKFRS